MQETRMKEVALSDSGDEDNIFLPRLIDFCRTTRRYIPNLSIYILFVCDLFHDAGSSSDCIVSDDRTISE
jgi:hypothetical protein